MSVVFRIRMCKNRIYCVIEGISLTVHLKVDKHVDYKIKKDLPEEVFS
jgi:hypothetical protein